MRSGTPGNSEGVQALDEDRQQREQLNLTSLQRQRRYGPLLHAYSIVADGKSGHRRGRRTPGGDSSQFCWQKEYRANEITHPGGQTPAVGFYNKRIAKRRAVQLRSWGHRARWNGLVRRPLHCCVRVLQSEACNTFVLSRTSNESVSLKLGNDSGSLIRRDRQPFDHRNLYPVGPARLPALRIISSKQPF
jgi:hypothetical protein